MIVKDMSANSVNGSTGSGRRWSWWEAARSPIVGSEATAWWQLAMISVAAGLCWSVGGNVIGHQAVRAAFYVFMAVYLIAAVWLYGLGPVSRYGLAKTSAVIVVSFALPAVALSLPWALAATVIAVLSARAFIGVEESEAACVQLPSGLI